MKRSLIVVALLFVAVPLAAQMHPGRQPGLGMMNGGSMMGDITVGPDGTVYAVRHASGSTTALELVSINPSTGTPNWKASLENGGAMIIAVGSGTVFVSSFGSSGTFPNLMVKSQLLGFQTGSGAAAFPAINLDGIAMDLTPFNGGVYVLEISSSTSTMPMTSIGRKLLSVSNSGSVNWTLSLD